MVIFFMLWVFIGLCFAIPNLVDTYYRDGYGGVKYEGKNYRIVRKEYYAFVFSILFVCVLWPLFTIYDVYNFMEERR